MHVSILTLSPLSLMVLETQASAKVKSLCSLVTNEDAWAFFGAAPGKRLRELNTLWLRWSLLFARGQH